MSDKVQISVVDALEMLEIHLRNVDDLGKAAMIEVMIKLQSSAFNEGFNRATILERTRTDNLLRRLQENQQIVLNEPQIK